MKKISFLALAGVLAAGGLSAAPALAAVPTAPGQVPYCSSVTTDTNLKNGIDAQQLARPGSTLNSLEVWNGCLKAIYTDSSGHSSTAIYDPDTLQLLDTLGDSKLG